MFDQRYYVTFESDNGLSLTVLTGENSPVMTAGYGGWETVERPKRKSMTRYKGKDPFKQDISIRFEGLEDGESQEPFIQTLERMDMSPSQGTPPSLLSISGLALRTDLKWIIENIDWDNAGIIWDVQGGNRVRLRQDATVHLMEFVDDNIIITAPSPAVMNSPNKKDPSTRVVHGETLKQVAQDVYGDPSKYLTILLANPLLDPDPRAIIPAGTILSIPPLYGTGIVQYQVI